MIKVNERDMKLVVQFMPTTKVNIDLLEKPEKIQWDLDAAGKSFKMSSGSHLNLYDCLGYFMMEETLSGNDKWYCSKCKDHVNARKKMEVYKTPEFLIVHLKRFSHNRH